MAFSSDWRKERFTKRQNQLIKVDEQIVNTLKEILVIAKSFDGKVINKRFIDKANERLKSLEKTLKASVSLINGTQLEIYINDRIYYIFDRIEYLDKYEYSFSLYNSREIEWIDVDSRRLNYNSLVILINDKIDYYNDKIAETRKALDNLDNYIEQIEKQMKLYKEFYMSLPTPLQNCVAYEIRGELQ
jgi:hypothetical protein